MTTSKTYLEYLELNTVSVNRFEAILEVLGLEDYKLIHKESNGMYGKNNYMNFTTSSLKFSIRFINTCSFNHEGETFWFIKMKNLIKKQKEKLQSSASGFYQILIMFGALELVFKNKEDEMNLKDVLKNFPKLENKSMKNEFEILKEKHPDLETFDLKIDKKNIENINAFMKKMF